MKRLNCSTDIALIGAWDIGMNDDPISKNDFANIESIAERDSKEGKLFFIKTNADGGGPIDVYVNEDIPDEVREYCKDSNGEFLLSLPTGKLKFAGLEEYRNEAEKLANEHNSIDLPKGDYCIECHVCKTYDEFEDTSTENELRKRIPKKDIEYFDKRTVGAFKWAFGLTSVAFISLIILTKWFIAVPASIVFFVAFFHIYDFVLKKDQKYQKLSLIIPRFRILRERPTFVFALKEKDRSQGLSGGYIEL